MRLQIALGALIRERRLDQGLSQTKFAKQLQRSTRWVQHIERGTLCLNLKAILALETTLHVPTDSLLRTAANVLAEVENES